MLTFRQVRTIMVRFDASFWIVGVNVECIQVRTDLFDRREVLGHCGATFEYATLDSARISWDLTALGFGALRTGCHREWMFSMIGSGC